MDSHGLANRAKQPGPPVLTDTGAHECVSRGKPTDNPARPKPTYATDDECAQLLGDALRQVPSDLVGSERSSFRLLESLKTHDASRGTDVAREIVFIAAMIHRTADERRTAEYLLRNRQGVVDGSRHAAALLAAARCAAEMDVRRIRRREAPTDIEAMSAPRTAVIAGRADDPSVGDLVIAFLARATGCVFGATLTDALRDAVVAVLELAERHALNAGTGPSLLAMRPAARKDARLITHLRDRVTDPAVARRIARLLIGSDGTPIDTAALWWAASSLDALSIAASTRARWSRDLRRLDRLVERGRERAAA